MPSLISTQEGSRHQCGWFHGTFQPNLDSDIHEKGADRWQEIQTRGWWLYWSQGLYRERCWYRGGPQRAVLSVVLYSLQWRRGKIRAGLEAYWGWRAQQVRVVELVKKFIKFALCWKKKTPTFALIHIIEIQFFQCVTSHIEDWLQIGHSFLVFRS